jgi:hypothetical protein
MPTEAPCRQVLLHSNWAKARSSGNVSVNQQPYFTARKRALQTK